MTLAYTVEPIVPTLELAERSETLRRSQLRELIAVVSRPGILSLAGGLPDPALFPRDAYATALQQVLAEDPLALQYAPPWPALKEQVVTLMAARGVDCRPEQILLTGGAQQALDILARLLLDPGDALLLERNIYSGILQTVLPYRPRIWPVNTDLQTGMDVQTVADYLARGIRPAFLYVIPDGHNPLGVSLNQAGRERLIALARYYGVPIIEDDPYGHLAYDGPALPPLRALDDRWVFYVGSFAKIMAPALRLGWLVAPVESLEKLTILKEASDLEVSALTQRAVAAYLAAGHLPAHLEGLRQAYGRRRDAMLAALAAHFPPGARWTRPSGGMFVWVELPAPIDTSALLPRAIAERQVAFVPGSALSLPGEPAGHCLRLTFANLPPDRITAGVAALGELIAAELAALE